MSEESSDIDIYIRFLTSFQAIEDGALLAPLDPLEESILRVVALAHVEQSRLGVREMMARREIAARCTIHARLKSLCEKGWIAVHDTHEGRREQIELTEASLAHFDMIGNHLIQVAKRR